MAALRFLGESGSFNHLFRMFDSQSYGRYDLMVTDATIELVDVGDKDTYYSWVGKLKEAYIIMCMLSLLL